MEDRRTWVAAALALQAGAGVLWWVGMAASPDFRSAFELVPDAPDLLDGFLLPDLVGFIGGSVVSAVLVLRGSRRAVAAMAATAGGAGYATLYLVMWVGRGGDGAAGVLPMLAATALTGTAAVWAFRHGDQVRERGGDDGGA